MLAYTAAHSAPSLPLLLLHDDADREFDYTAGAEQALDQAAAEGWTVTSIKHDWTTVFADDHQPYGSAAPAAARSG